MRIGVLGGGFGLYGYVPALFNLNHDVVLPRRHRTKLQNRMDVKDLDNRIHWSENEDTLLQDCSAIVIAVPPMEQPGWVERCIALPNITHLLLEKPVATTPDEALKLHEKLTQSGKTFRVGYNFRFTDWGQNLLAQKNASDIEWTFNAHHFASNVPTWKKDHTQGGGALRFYGIHLIALLSELGYDSVTSSTLSDDSARWEADFSGPGLPACHITVSSNDKNKRFAVNGQETPLFAPSASTADSRVPYLKTLLNDWMENTAPYYDWYLQTLTLWRLAEEKTI